MHTSVDMFVIVPLPYQHTYIHKQIHLHKIISIEPTQLATCAYIVCTPNCNSDVIIYAYLATKFRGHTHTHTNIQTTYVLFVYNLCANQNLSKIFLQLICFLRRIYVKIYVFVSKKPKIQK